MYNLFRQKNLKKDSNLSDYLMQNNGGFTMNKFCSEICFISPSVVLANSA
jgi:hypothetical protein